MGRGRADGEKYEGREGGGGNLGLEIKAALKVSIGS